ncbi:DUF1801 domain-containing protein [Paludisphaera rhizosphaerae]|uniref:DUF1801 domain-containing protein n=1 Tax=Paludisphaera rhizosphaerae TaxID=2711216 RepID=UPI0013ED612E|nr:DUF1801 domain-containing protein [Paludisphaera rhizosphaerae]
MPGGKKPTAKESAKPSVKADPDTGAKPAIGAEASGLIDERLQSLGDWRAETLTEVRRLIHEADPDVVEEWKWMGTPVWSHAGNLCTGETYKQVVKLTFARGASVEDPHGLFNSSLVGNTRRAIDIREGETLNAAAFRALIKAAVAENLRSKSKPGAKAKAPGKAAGAIKKPESQNAAVPLLSGGNPQIAKADGDAPVQAYIAAMPDWKSDLGRRLDALIERTVPSVQKAVKWNSPFYGVENQGWFLSFHVFTRYVKVTFFKGTSLHPIPPGGTERSKEARWIDVYENDPLDEQQMEAWVKQAAETPGWLA